MRGSPGSGDEDLLFECGDGSCALVVLEIGGVNVCERIEGLDLAWYGEEGVDAKGAR